MLAFLHLITKYSKMVKWIKRTILLHIKSWTKNSNKILIAILILEELSLRGLLCVYVYFFKGRVSFQYSRITSINPNIRQKKFLHCICLISLQITGANPKLTCDSDWHCTSHSLLCKSTFSFLKDGFRQHVNSVSISIESGVLLIWLMLESLKKTWGSC